MIQKGIDNKSYHPDSKVKFSSVIIPDFEKKVEDVIRLHWKIPQFRLLSWDTAIDENNDPVLIEVNMHSGQLDFLQFNNGPVFGDDTEKF